MEKKQERLSRIEKAAIMLAAALPIATFVFLAFDSEEVGPDVEI
ncbi:MAG: hypothetical protein WD187_03230 [Candidatus Woykebacteria bacterium]